MIAATVAGNIGRDAEIKTIGKDSVCEFTVASGRKVKGEDVTTWVRCTIWGKRGESLCQYLSKGTAVVVVGELSMREYQKKDGTKGASLEMRANDIKLMGGGTKRDARPAPSPAASSGGGGGSYADADYGSDTPDDDIPFLANVTGDPRERWWAR